MARTIFPDYPRKAWKILSTTLARAKLKLFAIPSRFHGMKFCTNLSRSQILAQTIQIISDNRILNWNQIDFIWESIFKFENIFSFNVKILHFWALKRPQVREIETKIRCMIRILMWVLFRTVVQRARRKINTRWVR